MVSLWTGIQRRIAEGLRHWIERHLQDPPADKDIKRLTRRLVWLAALTVGIGVAVLLVALLDLTINLAELLIKLVPAIS